MGVETTTGPLGQGVANSVGMALAERWLAHRFNRPGHAVVDHHTWALCSDGDLMEGISHEAAEFAGHQRLGKLIWVFDDNHVTIDGGTDLSCSTDHGQRFRAYGWDVRRVEDGTDLAALDAALTRGRVAETERPSLVIVRTTIGYGSPGKAGSSSAHGAPLGVEEVDATKRNLGYPSRDPFHVEAEALAHWREAACAGGGAGEGVAGTVGGLPGGASLRGRRAARGHGGRAAGRLGRGHPRPERTAEAARDPRVLRAGAAGAGAAPPQPAGRLCRPGRLQQDDPALGREPARRRRRARRTIHFGVREHAMGGILNGMALHGGVRPYGGTFLIFSDYMRPSIRLAALMHVPVTYVFTHDSIGVGEDGPTHQPIEQLMSLRAIPGVLDLRPGDGPETAEAWRAALAYRDGPSFLALTRQAVAIIDRSVAAPATGLHRGGYVLLEADGGDPGGDPHRKRLGGGRSRAGACGATGGGLTDTGGLASQLVPLRPSAAELPR